ncbi:hypothetical protein DRN63_03495 [Nanoarchaeota archaeon]|nr:MAG: hypothetical protein DRN63_03495 [Nanoarchaeota archaeon]
MKNNKGYFLSLVVFPILLLILSIFFVKLLELRIFLAQGIENELKILEEVFKEESKMVNNTTYWQYVRHLH